MSSVGRLTLSVACLILSLVYSVYYFGLPMPDFPSGCDAFGHLRMAQYVESGNLLRHDYNRPFHAELIAYLDSKGFQTHQYAWMLAPHAHHVQGHVKRVINQYQPGSGALLSLVRLPFRILFYPFVATLFTIIVLVAASFMARESAYDGLALAAFSVVVVHFFPITEKYFSDPMYLSLPFTFGALIASGYLLRNRTRTAFFFLGLTLLFRLSNVIYTPVFVLYACIYAKMEGMRRRGFILFVAQCLAALLAGGLGAMLIYQYGLLGNPWTPTYSQIDTAFISSFKDFLENLHFYGLKKYGFTLANVAMLLLIYLLTRNTARRLSARLFAVLLVAVNYAYYLTHQVHIPYYPFSTAFILLGIVFDLGLKRSEAARPIVTAAALAICCVVYVVCLAFSDVANLELKKKQAVEETAKLAALFSPFDVVWAEELSGTVEYTSSANGFRYRWASDELRGEIVKWLYDHKYSQAFLLDDLGAHDAVRGFVSLALPNAKPRLMDGARGPMLVVQP